MEFLHPAMSHVALESWQWIHRVVAPCNVIRGSGMTCHWIRPNVRHIRVLCTSGFDFDHITAVDMSFCTSHRNFIQIGPPWAEKNDVMSCHSRLRISAILDFSGSVMGSLKSPCTTSYRSSTDSSNCWVFEKIAFLYFGDRQTNKQTNRQTNRRTAPKH